MTMRHPLSLLAFALLPCFAHAISDSTLLNAREAFRNNDSAQLASLGNSSGDRDPLAAWPGYWQARLALDNGDDNPSRAFISNGGNAFLRERLLNDWVQSLGKRGDWDGILRVAPALSGEARDADSSCWLDVATLNRRQTVASSLALWQNVRLSDGCARLVEEQAARGILPPAQTEARMRLLLAGNYLTVARRLAAAANLGERFFTAGGAEQLVQQLLTLGKNNPVAALERAAASEAMFSKAQSGFLYGQLALRSAQRLNMPQALDAFERADPQQLTDEQWEWWLRAALRQQDWGRLEQLSRRLPEELASKAAWQYWRARSLQALGRGNEATPLLIKTSFEHNYYGLLAKEELGTTLEAPLSRSPTPLTLQRQLLADPDIQHALALFELSLRNNKPEWREDGRRVWRWALRGRNDEQLLAAAEIALERNLYDMAIYAAERTVRTHDFSLRFLTPYRDTTRRYASQLEIDEAWVYGLIRQESRFLNVARSGVGASGLMQLMPATAKWVAGKMGLPSYQVNDVDTNIRLGTWYLRHVLDNLSSHPVLATAAYNAGPGRARGWQAAMPLEGAIYAETIPFSETRDYVQKVMANAVYYAGAFRQPGNTLKSRLGTIPAR